MNEAPTAKWVKIKGFDVLKGEYIRLNCDDWLINHKIKEEGEERGKLNQPSADASSPDEMYENILAWVNGRALDCKENVKQYIGDKLKHLTSLNAWWDRKSTVPKLEALARNSCVNLENLTAKCIDGLLEPRTDYEQAERDLREFCQLHQLSRPADYPPTRINHWLWIIGFLVFESFANANLLGSVAPGGVMEGWMIALALSIVNVIAGIGAGLSYRYTHKKKRVTKIFFYCFVAFWIMLVLFWNAVAGHMRDIFAGAADAQETSNLSNLNVAFADAWDTMMEQPLPWESIQSAGLAAIGLAVFSLTAYKLYTSDDQFPGYGHKDRTVKQLSKKYQDMLDRTRQELKTARDKVNSELEDWAARYDIEKAAHKNTLDEISMVINTYSENLRQYNLDLRYIISAYRTANETTRTEAVPKFFSVAPTIDEDLLEPPEFVEPEHPDWGDIPAKVKEALDEVADTFENQWQQIPRLSDINKQT